MWEVLRAWLNWPAAPGLRFTPWWCNVMMLVTALVFIFMLELLLTMGIQIWERRVLGRMQQPLGPAGVRRDQHQLPPHPSADRHPARVPAVFYGLQYWSGYSVTLPPFKRMLAAG